MKLSERVERAEGPSRELFWEVWETAFPRPADILSKKEGRKRFIDEYGKWLEYRGRLFGLIAAEAWLDAAMLLLPEGWAVGSLEWWPMRKSAGVTLLETREHDIGYGYDADTDASSQAHATDPALALLAACLKARGL